MQIQIIRTPRCAHCLDDIENLGSEIEIWVDGKDRPVYVCSEICAEQYKRIKHESLV